MRIELEISDGCEESLRIIKAVNSGRTTAQAKKPEEFKEAFENAHRLTALVSDEILSKVLSLIE